MPLWLRVGVESRFVSIVALSEPSAGLGLLAPKAGVCEMAAAFTSPGLRLPHRSSGNAPVVVAQSVFG